MAPGVQHYTLFQMGKETTAGTAVAATKIWYPDGTGAVNIDPMQSQFRGNRGTKTHLVGAIQKGVGVSIPFRSNPDMGIGYDELVYLLNQAGGGTAGTGASADKTWTWAPSQTAADTTLTYTIEVGDDNQFWEFEYSFAPSFTLSAARDGMTEAEVNWVARQPTKTTKTSLTAPAVPQRIPGLLWKPRFATSQAGLAGASDQSNFLLDWQAEIQTGWVPRFYQDGNNYFGQMVQAAELKANLTMHVESTALAVSEFYDKWNPGGAPTVDFIQLKALGPTLGGSNYSATLQFAVIYTQVNPIASEQDGVNIYEIQAETVYDSTWSQSMGGTVVNSIGTAT